MQWQAKESYNMIEDTSENEGRYPDRQKKRLDISVCSLLPVKWNSHVTLLFYESNMDCNW